ncbi:MAG: hypothetical protein WCQ16_01840 [Verrucomicrobiae bacterium]
MSRLGCAAAAVIALAPPACERHAASQTVPGHAEKLAEKQAAENQRATTPETVNPNPPKFFPAEK